MVLRRIPHGSKTESLIVQLSLYEDDCRGSKLAIAAGVLSRRLTSTLGDGIS